MMMMMTMMIDATIVSSKAFHSFKRGNNYGGSVPRIQGFKDSLKGETNKVGNH